MRALHLLSVAVFLAATVSSAAQSQPVSLEQIEAIAVQNNAELKALAREVAVAESRVAPAGALEDATLMYRGWGTPLREPWNFNRAQNMFMFSQSLSSRGKRGLRTAVARQQVETTRAQLEAARREVVARARKAYFDLLRTQDELRIHHEQLVIAEQASESARVKYTVGRVPQQDVLKAQVAVTRLVEHRLMFEQEADLARAELNTLMGRPPDAPLEVAGTYVLPRKLPGVAELTRLAIERRPELALRRSEAERAALQLRLARKAYTPEVTLGAGYMLMPKGSSDRNALMAEVSLNLPWFNRGRHDAEIAAAQSETALETAKTEAASAQVLLEIQQAFIRARVAERLVELYGTTLRPQAQTTFKAATAAYQTDRTDFLNLLDAQNTLLDVEYAYYRVLAEYDAQLAQLELAVGAPIGRSERAIAEVNQ
jgi:outer membrane protein, heavy metal efflux system